ncbi:hypothetical protein ACN28S_61600 [Cystobacter fuscus]
MKTLLSIAVLASVCISSIAEAQLGYRCSLDDQLGTAELGRGRNAWARKCGFIKPTKEAFLNGEGEYRSSRRPVTLTPT